MKIILILFCLTAISELHAQADSTLGWIDTTGVLRDTASRYADGKPASLISVFPQFYAYSIVCITDSIKVSNDISFPANDTEFLTAGESIESKMNLPTRSKRNLYIARWGNTGNPEYKIRMWGR